MGDHDDEYMEQGRGEWADIRPAKVSLSVQVAKGGNEARIVPLGGIVSARIGRQHASGE